MSLFWDPLTNLRIPVTVALASIAAIGYAASRFRGGEKQFRLLDALQIVFLMIVVTGASVPLLEAAAMGARQSTMLQNLYALRSQIALYKAQHRGEPPVLYLDALPQLLASTNEEGVPGPPSGAYRFGPYLNSIPVNTMTGKSVMTATPCFPPTAASGHGGWLYHQETGQVAPDLPDLLNR